MPPVVLLDPQKGLEPLNEILKKEAAQKSILHFARQLCKQLEIIGLRNGRAPIIEPLVLEVLLDGVLHPLIEFLALVVVFQR